MGEEKVTLFRIFFKQVYLLTHVFLYFARKVYVFNL